MQKYSVSPSYLEKQKNFRSLVKDIQISLTSKEYKNKGLSFNKYIKIRWNISQAQAYRYLMCAKVLDQLEEFEIQPSYERICNALSHTAKTTSQMKLLWSVILQKAGNVPESINSTHIKKIWKEICQNDKNSSINNNSVSKTVENRLTEYLNEKKHKQLAKMAQMQPTQVIQTVNPTTNNISIPYSKIPSPVLSESSITSKDNQSLNVNSVNNMNNINMNNVNIPLSPINNICNGYNSIALPVTVPASVPNVTPTTISASVPTTIQNGYYMMSPNEIPFQPQQIIYYY